MCWIQVWMPWRQRYNLYIGIKIINSKRRISYDQDLECWIFKRRIQDMALNRRHDCLMSWDMFDKDLEHATKWRVLYVPQDDLECWSFKRGIQDMALNWRHGCLMSWDMVDKDLEHAMRWRVPYVAQDINLEHEKIHGWPILRVEFGFKICQHMKHEECATWILWYGKPRQLCFMN